MAPVDSQVSVLYIFVVDAAFKAGFATHATAVGAVRTNLVTSLSRSLDRSVMLTTVRDGSPRLAPLLNYFF